MRSISLVLIFFTTLSAIASSTTYTNDSDCTVEVESHKNGTIYYVSQGNKNEVVGITNDFTSGSFVYCDDSVLQINYFEGKKGTGIMMSCNEHQNGNAVTRGRVDIDIIDGELTKIAIDGQVKKLFGWKQDTKIECLNLIKQ